MLAFLHRYFLELTPNADKVKNREDDNHDIAQF